MESTEGERKAFVGWKKRFLGGVLSRLKIPISASFHFECLFLRQEGSSLMVI